VANGTLIKGKVGTDLTLQAGQAAARACALNLLAQAQAVLGDLDLIARCVKLTGFVNAPADFTDHPKVIDGASGLMVDVFGEAGKHARAAVGAGSLPLGAAVEIEAIFEIGE
jgi:enamine deaminase RidA (YjgF/YER057c/UK114 family)